MPAFGLWLVYLSNDEIASYNHTPDMDFMQRFILMVLSVSGVIIMISLIFRNSGVIKSLEAEETQDRLRLYAVAIACFSLVYYALRKQEVLHPSVLDAYFGALLAMLLCFGITFFYKISAHMIGISGVVGILYALSNITFSGNTAFIILALVLCGIIGTARMFRKAHSLDQIIAGAVLGFLSTYLSICQGWGLF